MVDNMKKGAHGIIGKSILGVHFIVGTASRLQAFLSLYESLVMNAFIVEEYSAFHRAAVLLFSSVTPFCLHYLGSIILQKYFLGDILDDRIQHRLQNALNSFISCPLFLDWEVLFRSSRCKLTIKECFHRSIRFLLAHNVLVFVENCLFNMPLLFNLSLQREWPGDIALVINTHFIFFILNIFATFLLTGGLACFFFIKMGHPWNRVLRRELSKSPKENLINSKGT